MVGKNRFRIKNGRLNDWSKSQSPLMEWEWLLYKRRRHGMFGKYSDIITPAQLQKILGIGRNNVYKLLSEQIIKSKKIGRKYFIPKSNVIKFLESK